MKYITRDRRKEWKKKAKHTLKTHYVLLVMVAVLATLIGVETGYSFSNIDLTNAKNITVTNEQRAKTVAGKLYNQAKKVEDISESNEKEKAVHEKILELLMEGKFRAGEKLSDEDIQSYTDAPVTKDVMSRNKGVLAGLVNNIASGKFLVRLANGVNTVIKSKQLAGALVILLVLLLYFALWFLLINPYKVMMARVYMESRTYEKVPINHLFFLRTIRKWRTAAKSMFRYWLYSTLWAFTIIGGIIKYYSYWCVPYILAENPALTGKEAILLSRKMMNGHKWETFKYDCTFIGWILLSALTLGLADIFFVMPYKRSTDAELFAYYREESKKAGIEGSENLKDMFLYEKADSEVLSIKYGDILYRKTLAEKAEVKLTGIKAFLVRNFGIWIGSDAEQQRYEEVEIEEVNLERAELCAQGLAYPERYNPLWNDVAEEHAATRNNYLKSYSIWSLIAMFAIFAFVGWGWEVAIHLVKDGVFINRGVQHGPWLPIYGAGAVMILVLLKRLRKKPAALAAAAVVLCGFVEYFSSYFLEISRGIRWWDYTGYFLNLNGRICAEGLTVFAVAGMAAVYVLAPALDRLLQRINIKVMIPLCLAFCIVFTGDAIYSMYYPNVGQGITDYQSYQQVE